MPGRSGDTDALCQSPAEDGLTLSLARPGRAEAECFLTTDHDGLQSVALARTLTEPSDQLSRSFVSAAGASRWSFRGRPRLPSYGLGGSDGGRKLEEVMDPFNARNGEWWRLGGEPRKSG